MKKVYCILIFILLSVSITIMSFSIKEAIGLNKIDTITQLGLQSIVEQTETECTNSLKSKSLLPLLNHKANNIETVTFDENKKSAKSSIVLYDSEKPQFVCTEFVEGGYAITRIKTGRIYERTELGNSPYHSKWNYKCYYFGTQNY